MTVGQLRRMLGTMPASAAVMVQQDAALVPSELRQVQHTGDAGVVLTGAAPRTLHRQLNSRRRQWRGDTEI